MGRELLPYRGRVTLITDQFLKHHRLDRFEVMFVQHVACGLLFYCPLKVMQRTAGVWSIIHFRLSSN